MRKVLVQDANGVALRVVRFGLVGVIASGIYAVAGLVLIDGLGIASPIASGLAYVIAIPVSFLGQRHFTFGSRGAVRHELPRFVFVQIFNIALAIGIMALVTDVLGQSHQLGIIAVILCIPAVTFLLLATTVFRAKRRGPEKRPKAV